MSHELRMASLFQNNEPVLLHLDLQAARAQGEAKDQAASAVRDVYETSDSREAAGETGDVHAAFRIHFHRAEHTYVETSAIIEVELRRLVDYRFGKMTATEAEARCWHAAGRTALDSEGEFAKSSRFCRHHCDALGQADAEIHNISRAN